MLLRRRRQRAPQGLAGTVLSLKKPPAPQRREKLSAELLLEDSKPRNHSLSPRIADRRIEKIVQAWGWVLWKGRMGQSHACPLLIELAEALPRKIALNGRQSMRFQDREVIQVRRFMQQSADGIGEGPIVYGSHGA